MNQIQHIKRINEAELESGTTSSWHDQYKDSAYVNVGGLPFNLTEGDVITIFSQYGEVVDINMPRAPETGKPRGFAWLMYMDQRSTVLAVDNLNGAQVLGRTLRVDHVLDYKQLERDQETGKMKEREERSLAAHPEKFINAAGDGAASDAESESSHGSIDLDDPIREYLIEQKRAAKKRRIESGGGGESKEERKRQRDAKRREKEAKRAEREKRKGRKAVESGGGDRRERDRGEERRRDDRSVKREDERPVKREDDRQRSRDYSPRRVGGGRRSVSPRRDERRRDNYDDRRRDDRDRDHRRRDDREDRDRRPGAGGGGADSFADLERWARSGGK